MTPFSLYIMSIFYFWENCTPIYVDIHPEYLTIDESKIEEKITDKTSAILKPPHVFGNPCHVFRNWKIAQKI